MYIKQISTATLISLLSMVTLQGSDGSAIVSLQASETELAVTLTKGVKEISNAVQNINSSNVTSTFDAHANQITVQPNSIKVQPSIIGNMLVKGLKGTSEFGEHSVEWITTHKKATAALAIGGLFVVKAVLNWSEKCENEEKSKKILEEFKKVCSDIFKSWVEVNTKTQNSFNRLDKKTKSVNNSFQRITKKIKKTEIKVKSALDDAKVTIKNIETISTILKDQEETLSSKTELYEEMVKPLSESTQDDTKTLIQQSKKNNAANEAALKRIKAKLNNN